MIEALIIFFPNSLIYVLIITFENLKIDSNFLSKMSE